MSYLTKMLAILVSVLVLAGCGLQEYRQQTDVSGYPCRYAAFDYKYAWKTTVADHGVVIEGVMKNVRYPYIESALLKVELLDKDGKAKGSAADFPMPQQTRDGDESYFGLLLEGSKPVAGDTFRFTLHYKGHEGGNNGDVNWISNFTVDALTGAVIKPPGKNPDSW